MSKKHGSTDPKNGFTSLDIASYLWIIPVLENLTDIGAFLKFCGNKARLNGKENTYALGYSFASCLALQQLIQVILDGPEVFGVKRDERVERAFQSNISFLETPTSSPQGKIIVSIAKLYRPLLGVKSFNEFKTEIEPVKSKLLPILREVTEFHGISAGYRSIFKNMEVAQRHAAIIALHFFYQDIRKVKIAFSMTFGRSKLSHAQRIRLPETFQKSQKFFEGYKLAVGYLWHSLLGEEATKYSSIRNMLDSHTWKGFDSFYKDIQSEIITPLEDKVSVDIFHPTTVFIVRKSINIDLADRFLAISGLDATKEKTDEEMLDRVFLGYPIRIVDHDITASGTSGFVVALVGASSVIKEKVKVIRFLHGHIFSYALLIPASSNIGDYSTWWLFYSFCSDDSGMGSAGYHDVEKYLKRLTNRVDLQEFAIENVVLREYAENHSEYAELEHREQDSFDDFGPFLNQKYSPSPRRRLESARHYIEKLKGDVLELIVSTIISQLGYRIVWGYKNSSILGDRQVDILGFKNSSYLSELIIVECTTSFDKSLPSELKGKKDRIISTIREVTKQFDWNLLQDYVVKGLVVTTDSPKYKITSSDDIEVWSRKELLEKCKAFGIKVEYIDQLFPERHIPKGMYISSSEDFQKFWVKLHEKLDE